MKGVYLLLGSNLQDREKLLREATETIDLRLGKVLHKSHIYETEAWGVREQPLFLNQVLEIETALAPMDLLLGIQQIEQQLGRVRHERWGERTIDIDILFYGNEQINAQRLTVPHPEIQNRKFTLLPMAEIAGSFQHPVFQKDMKALLSDCKDDLKVWIYSAD
ncbi:2-amino-4-hydroxy-6-hydroxymethyldihydropteridine diphosphokinase [Persicobacter sp. CCB-QB2]|uniref:2-amino-4-hydroxy-6- hydroxymethyldihydropteridine diphosphokinase n=1 Tax=Persicobacter sp. CCB-QB2 TaxID=1561025 RepID=UPI0006A98000|nr:2-amino-4-hydroxy-6-hydroxymethyldihydropteridine diphosphokinase [Persicobacter sp. CCB-QB2]